MSNDQQTPKPSEDSGTWSFVGDDKGSSTPNDAKTQKKTTKSVRWSAAEYADHDKSVAWYATLVFAAIVFSAVVYLITKDKIAAGIIIFAGVIFAVYGGRKPRILNYVLEDTGITIDTKFYDFELFRSFSVVDVENPPSLLFVPLKRFMPLMTIYYPKKDEDKIMAILNNRLPIDNKGYDVMERFLRRINY